MHSLLHICIQLIIHCNVRSKKPFTHSLSFSSHFSVSPNPVEDSASQAGGNSGCQQDTSNEASPSSTHTHTNTGAGTGH